MVDSWLYRPSMNSIRCVLSLQMGKIYDSLVFAYGPLVDVDDVERDDVNHYNYQIWNHMAWRYI